MLHRLFGKLNSVEKQQLTDLIISGYNVINYDYAISLFGSYENMVHAMHCTTGSEYDLKEKRIGKSDIKYPAVTTFLKQYLNIKDIHKIFALSEQQRQDLFLHVLKHIDITPQQLAKYLRVEIERV